jgi:signal transduction histidine kinase
LDDKCAEILPTNNQHLLAHPRRDEGRWYGWAEQRSRFTSGKEVEIQCNLSQPNAEMVGQPEVVIKRIPVRLSIFWVLGWAFSLPPTTAPAQTNLPLLTTARQVHQLTIEQAALQYPVRVRAVVTFAEEPREQLFVQDETEGIFVEIHGDYGFRLRTGQLLEIEGVSTPGGFAPNIVPHRVTLLGEAPLPQPRPVTFDQIAAGQEDCNWVEFNGIVRSVRYEPVTRGLNLVGGSGRIIVPIGNPDLKICERLIDAEVSVRGVCIAQVNSKEQLIQVAIRAPSMAEVSVTKPAPADPFAVPLRKCSHLLHYAPREEHGHRVKVRGVVTFQQPGRTLFIADETQGLYLQTRQTTPLQPGDVVEALGFPVTSEYVSPVLQDAVFQKIGAGASPPALEITPENGSRDTNHAALVQLEAVVLNRARRRHEQILQLQSGGIVFDARLDAAPGKKDPLASIPNGSRVRVTGICLVQTDLNILVPRSQAFSLLLRSTADVTLLERPSWWTVRHTLWVLAATLAVFSASLAWVAMLRNQVKAQTQIIRQKAQREAALEERTRIARDLHDELGASLTQISLLSDRPEDEVPSELQGNARKIAATAREMAQSLDEIVWAVNPEHDRLEGLVEYLTQSADDFLEDTPIRSRLKLPANLPRGTVPADVRHQLFLAFKEALNNAVKHAAASEIEIEFAAEPGRFQILIADNGVGFDPACPRAGGSGLNNMRRRLEAIGGQFELSSRQQQGTRIKMGIPL